VLFGIAVEDGVAAAAATALVVVVVAVVFGTGAVVSDAGVVVEPEAVGVLVFGGLVD